EDADPRALIELRRFLARPFALRRVDAATFDRLLSDHYAASAGADVDAAGALGLAGDEIAMPSVEDLLDTSGGAPAIRLITSILADAARQGVSDIHIEPFESGLVVRMRSDGALQETLRRPPHVPPV